MTFSKWISRFKKKTANVMADTGFVNQAIADAKIHASKNQYDSALSVLETAIEKAPSNDKLFGLYLNYLQKVSAVECEFKVQYALSKFENSSYVLRECAFFFNTQGDNEKALELQRKVVDMHPDSVPHLLLLCRYLRQDNLQSEMLKLMVVLRDHFTTMHKYHLLQYTSHALYLGLFDDFYRGVEFLVENYIDDQRVVEQLSKLCFHHVLRLNGEVDGDSVRTGQTIESRFEDRNALLHAFEDYYRSCIFKKLKGAGMTLAEKSYPNSPEETKDILFVSDNWNFLFPLIPDLLGTSNYRIRTLEPSLIKKRICHTELLGLALGDKLVDGTRNSVDMDTYWGRLVNKSDVIFVEWCNYSAVWTSWLKTKGQRLVVRVHSYEAFTVWPLLVNWSAVDELVFVAPHIKNIFIERYLKPAGALDTIKLSVMPNYNRFDYFGLARERSLTGDVTLGMVGYNNKNKNPRFLLEIIIGLIEKGLSPSIYYVGEPWSSDLTQEEEVYKQEFDQMLQDFGLATRVNFIPFTNDLSGIFEQLDFIVSGSAREGTHESIMQAMSVGAVPVILDWPLVKPWGGASEIYSNRWVVDSSKDAVDFILSMVCGSTCYASESNAACSYVKDRFGAEVMLPRYQALIEGRD